MSEGLSVEETAILGRTAALLLELYTPAGALICWSAAITSLGGKRPCDLYRDRDWQALAGWCDRLDALADGNFT